MNDADVLERLACEIVMNDPRVVSLREISPVEKSSDKRHAPTTMPVDNSDALRDITKKLVSI